VGVAIMEGLPVMDSFERDQGMHDYKFRVQDTVHLSIGALLLYI